MQDSLFLLLVVVNAYFFVTAIANMLYFRRATQRATLTHGPLVSVIIPARNEERSIGRCLESLLAQDYSEFEIVVVDDDSSDSTAQIVAEMARHDARIRLISSAPLPSGWMGKPHALSQGAAEALGEILLLTDADTVHEPQSVSWAVTNLTYHRADMLSGYLRQEYGSLGECIIVPTMYAMMLLVPLFLVPRTRSPRLAFAIGQYVAIRREALDAVGGFEMIRDSIVDDMAMATRMKAFGYRNIFLDAREAAGCHLYSGYRDAFAGITRSIYSALGAIPLVVFAVTVIVLGLIVGPVFSVVLSSIGLTWPSAEITIAVMLFAVQWALLVWDRDMPLLALALYPLVFLNLALMMIVSMLRTGFGHGVDWKGRTVRVPRPSDETAEADLQTPQAD